METDAKLLDEFPDARREELPVGYLFLDPVSDESVSPVVLAESDRYRAKGFEAVPFYKPISRCLP
jgi:hypothetical protein